MSLQDATSVVWATMKYSGFRFRPGAAQAAVRAAMANPERPSEAIGAALNDYCSG
jgi:hypothetical protein